MNGWLQRNMTPIVGFGLIATMLFVHFDDRGKPAPGPVVVDGRAVGKAARIAFAKTHASALRAAAAEIEKPGSDLSKIKSDTEKAWAASRCAAFDEVAVPALDEIIPPGTQVPTPGQRARYAAFLRDIATAEEEVR